MKLHKFDNYRQYVRTQVRGSHKHMNRRPGASKPDMDRIADYIKRVGLDVKSGVCHGARCGTEVKLLLERLPGATIFGTDLFAKDTERVIEWDYHATKPEWVGAFDLMYSNALDHSPTPDKALAAWMSQLKPTGRLFLCWTFYHTLEPHVLPAPGGDCFGAALHEYIQMVRVPGILYDLIWCEVGHGQVILVVGPRT